MRLLWAIATAFLFGCSTFSAYAPIVQDPPAIHYKISYTVGFRPMEQVKLSCAVKILNRVVNTEDFQRRVLEAKFTEMRGLENWQILAKMANGFKGSYVNDMNFTMYHDRHSNIIAYVYMEIPHKVWWNRKYEYFSELYQAGTILHESMHLHGFNHLKEWDTSVPYHIEDLFMESAAEAFRYNDWREVCTNEGISDFSYLYSEQRAGESGREGPVCR